MPLDLSSLQQAIDALARSLRVAQATAQMDADLQETVRAGVIQNFEVAYELSWKFIQRWLRENRVAPEADFPRTRKDLFRLAAREGLIGDPIPWFAYGDGRNLTAHTYDLSQVLLAYQTAVRFPDDARDLFARLTERND